MENKFVILEDREWNNEGIKLKFIGTEDECFEWVLLNTSFSNTEAFENQGYVLVKVEKGRFTKNSHS